ncbi:MAG: 2-C-methyl-D-erythritol 4-phosphate cytidylyltransferase [Cyclobacteriaceae bacterium]
MLKSVIIVAGGSGTRMQNSLPKQFIKVLEKPLMVHTIEAFLHYDSEIQVVVVLPHDHFDTWNEIKKEYLTDQEIGIAEGGETRFQSVRQGLKLVKGELVAIHDAVRPMISSEVIDAAFQSAMKKGSGVAMVPVKDSIRETHGDQTIARDRSLYYQVQTPQTFQMSLISKAFERKEMTTFTDDASVFEAAGMSVERVDGDYRNIKITTPEDLILAEAILKNEKSL